MGYDLRDGSRGTYVAGGGVMTHPHTLLIAATIIAAYVAYDYVVHAAIMVP